MTGKIIFLSYAHEDVAAVERLFHALEDAAFNLVWIVWSPRPLMRRIAKS